MKIIIMRHGQAHNAAPRLSDRERPLTEEGKAEAQKMAQWIKDNEAVEKIISSPFVRARQTANIVYESLGLQNGIETEVDLCFHGNPANLPLFFSALPYQSVLVTSHMPIVSQLVAMLTQNTGPGFHTAGLAVVEYAQEGAGRLISFLSPTDLL